MDYLGAKQTMRAYVLASAASQSLIYAGFFSLSLSLFAGSEKMFQGSKLANYSTTKQLPTQTNRQRLIHKAKMKSLRISVVIIIAFLICWTPYYVMMIIFLFWNPDKRASMPKRVWGRFQVGVGFGFKLGRIGH